MNFLLFIFLFVFMYLNNYDFILYLRSSSFSRMYNQVEMATDEYRADRPFLQVFLWPYPAPIPCQSGARLGWGKKGHLPPFFFSFNLFYDLLEMTINLSFLVNKKLNLKLILNMTDMRVELCFSYPLQGALPGQIGNPRPHSEWNRTNIELNNFFCHL